MSFSLFPVDADMMRTCLVDVALQSVWLFFQIVWHLRYWVILRGHDLPSSLEDRAATAAATSALLSRKAKSEENSCFLVPSPDFFTVFDPLIRRHQLLCLPPTCSCSGVNVYPFSFMMSSACFYMPL